MSKRLWLARSHKDGASSGKSYHFLYIGQPSLKVKHDFKDGKPTVRRWWENQKGTEWGWALMNFWDSFGLKPGECCEIEVRKIKDQPHD